MKNFICKAEEAPSSAKLLLQSQYELAKNASFFSFSALESLKENVLFHWLMMLWSIGNVMTKDRKVPISYFIKIGTLFFSKLECLLSVHYRSTHP